MERQPCAPAAAPAAAALFSWGANSYGQLGLGHKEDVLLPQQLKDFCKPGCVRRITGGGGHSAVVTDEGGFFVCGLNKDGQLGLGHTEDVLCFTLCKYLLGCPVQQVACGWDFTIILTEEGQVLSCGSNSFGQLGVPHGPRRCVVPQAIELLREKVVWVAAGLRHALAATVSGIVYQWGTGLASSARRLCPGQPLPSFLTAKEPSRVTDLGNSKATHVLAGSDHSASLTESGKVFTWGRADYGQLGRKLESNEGQKLEKQDPSFCLLPLNSTPSSLHCLTGAAEISCGSEHNLAVIGGACYSWGWNEHGMCGDGTEVNVWIPKPVQGLPSASGLLVGCGAGHSLALCQLPAHTALGQECQVTYPSPDATKDTGSQVAMDKERSCKKRQSGSPTQSPSDRSRNGEL
ncbi:secretion-regulating guanine nucleotide exchange factor isoform X4 [Perognathus longimembris pacificus]|uniref:secretion-regulating guanine nucleotide exchange factor isoform X4 n=1 Tax=Perognathus longimembris pacificus TaxID=214514 RepID=UPI00201958C9|nr:secretion-regulating guanine nucleotide exchange factor isoform X4 [Perognathus longimembris pacificus]